MRKLIFAAVCSVVTEAVAIVHTELAEKDRERGYGLLKWVTSAIESDSLHLTHSWALGIRPRVL